MVCQFNAWDRVSAAYRRKDVCVLNKVFASVRIRSKQDEVVSIIRVGDVTGCCRLFRKRTSKRCGEELWWKSELKSPKTINL